MHNRTPVAATLRVSNADRRSVCSVNRVSPNVSMETAIAFVKAIEVLYNRGACTARMSVAYDIVTA